MDEDLLPDETLLPLVFVALCAALPSLGLSLLVLWGWVLLPRARAPKDEDLFVELRRLAELGAPLALVAASWGVLLWQYFESRPAALGVAVEVASKPWPLAPVVVSVAFVACGAAFGLAVVLRNALART